MATHTRAALCQTNAERPDAEYALVAGLYVAALLTPVVMLGLARAIADAAILYISFLGAVTGITIVAGWAVSRTAGLAVSLGRRDVTWLLAVVPFAWFVSVFGTAGIVGIEPPGIAVLLAMVTTGGGLFLGLILITMSRTRHAAAVLKGSDDLAQWEARWPPRWRRVSVGVAIIASVGYVGGIVAQVAFGVDWAGSVSLLMFLWAPMAGAVNPRTFRVTDAGLIVERPLQRQFRPWSAFASYELTDDALVIRPTAWWRPAHRCDRTDIEDVDAAVAALNQCSRKLSPTD